MGKTVHPLFVDLFKEPKLQKLRFCDAYSNFGESVSYIKLPSFLFEEY